MVVPKTFTLTLHLLVVLTFCTSSINGLKRLPNGTCPSGNYKCKDGLILPKWMPDSSLSLGDKVARAIIYFAGLAFMFLGVSIIADRFMAAIEVITSQEKLVTIKHPTGEKTTVSVRVWNETVSNLTLMALGSSAPEILLSVIEICGNNFDAGELGPGTIVGSAAFNMFMIIAICVYVVPSSENRKVKHLRVFFITSAWSLFAYIWLYIIISVSSKGVIDVWEGTFTLLCFPLTVLSAYAVDKRIFFDRFLPKKYRQSHNLVVAGEGSDVEMDKMADGKIDFLPDGVLRGMSVDESNEVREFEQHRREYIRVLRDLRKKHPDLDMDSLETMANFEIMNQGPKSRAFYRIQATRKLTGGGNILSKKRLEALEQDQKTKEVKVVAEDTHVTKIFFNPGHYTVFENVGTMFVSVARQGGDENNTVYVDYSTADGTANAGSDYDHVEGTLIFKPGETEKSIAVNIVDDDIFEEDEHFYVNLSNINVCDKSGVFISTDQIYQYAKLSTPFVATIMILDDDHSGLFTFENEKLDVVESSGEVRIRVCRNSGGRGRVRIFYRAIDGTAKKEKDYNIFGHELIFDNDQTEAFISIGVIDDEEYEKNEVFYIELLEPHLLDNDSDSGAEVGGKTEEEMTEAEKIAEMGKPRLGDIPRLTVHIKESKEFRNTVDKLVKKSNLSNLLGTSSWTEQFREALTVSAADEDDDDDDETAESRLPSCFDYVMHFLTVFWKVLFALVPPTDYWGGWLCFSVSMIVIGLLTAVIGDLASHFGCTIGLRDSVTAISFVALGTSVPDTFASKVAAIGDQYADSSIGNVTGSNAVNVFLGIGIAWSLAAVYHKIKGDGPFEVKTGTIAFSVTVYCVFALICIIVLVLRRHKTVGGELGGPTKYKIPTSLLFGTLWVTYVVISSLEAYCHIEGF